MGGFKQKDWPKYNYLKQKAKDEILKAKKLWAEKMKSTPNGLWKLAKSLSDGQSNDGFESVILNQNGVHETVEKVADIFAASLSEDSTHICTVDSAPVGDWNLKITQESIEAPFAN